MLLLKKNASQEIEKPRLISCNLCAAEFPVVKPLWIRPSDFDDFASDSATWSTDATRASDWTLAVFFRFDDSFVAGPVARFPDFVVASGFESEAPPVFDFGSEVDLPFPFTGGAVVTGGWA